MRTLALGFGVGVVVGGAVTGYALLNLQPTTSGKDVNKRKSNLDGIQYHPALKYGIPTTGLGTQNLKFYDGFVAAFDTRTRNPAWVLECIEWKESFEEGVDRARSKFYEDEEIEERFRNRMSDFHKSGYDRGHLAPAGSHMHSQKAMDETFTMNNISPQVGKGFNRTYWARFEKFVKGLAKDSESVYVVTGPLWLPKKDRKTKNWMMQYHMIGEPPSLISVPTHFYKVVLTERKGGKTGVGAFVMPNEQIDSSTPLARFTTPINDLECAAGFKFFPLYLDEGRMRVLDSAALEWKEYGMKQKAGMPKRLSEITDGGDDEVESSPGTKPEAVDEREIVVIKPQKVLDGKQIPRTGPFGKGAIHLCEQTGCKIPAEDFWLKKK